MEDKNIRDEKLEKTESFDALLRSALLETAREEARAEERLKEEIPAMPASLSDKISQLIAEDREKAEASEEKKEEDIIPFRRKRSRFSALANAAAVLIVGGAVFYGADLLFEGNVSGSSTAMVAEVSAPEEGSMETAAMPEAAAASPELRSNMAREAEAAPEAAAAEAEGTDEASGMPKAAAYDIGAAPEAGASENASEGPGALMEDSISEENAVMGAGIANPMEDKDSADQIEAELGLSMDIYPEASVTGYYVISGSIGQISYVTADGISCTYRVGAQDLGDISGVYYDLYGEGSVETNGTSINLGMADISDGKKAILLSWTYEEGSYSLYMEGCGDRDRALEEAERLMELL